MICGKLGAKHITGIEVSKRIPLQASKPLSHLAQKNITNNGLQNKVAFPPETPKQTGSELDPPQINVVNAMSTEVS
eukprot:1337567-Amorphochlora_amoeboformis.AAC.3